MNITLQSQSFSITEGIRSHVFDRFRDACGRFSSRLRSIEVYMKDINGPKGGIDKVVVARVRLVSGEQTLVQTSHEDLYAAISKSARCSRRAIKKELRKRREVLRRSPRSVASSLSLDGETA
ncbi:MAG: HPF/RaiA family ribosome-associated protein [Xanthomonadales bacterium]|nr:HPF/RaiA family ribosome-associated protein [Xanthomonadales bacterium]